MSERNIMAGLGSRDTTYPYAVLYRKAVIGTIHARHAHEARDFLRQRRIKPLWGCETMILEGIGSLGPVLREGEL